MNTPKSQATTLTLLALLLGACQAPEAEAPSPALSETTADIVGGRLEGGWPGVGALVFAFDDDEYYGAFCTGTLIHREWVLTAAHCLYDFGRSGDSIDTIYFYTGEDAQPSGGSGFPRRGRLYPTAQIFYHEDYEGNQLLPLSDVALVRLAVPADEEIYPMHLGDMEGRQGEDLFYVGFGLEDSINETGGGVKRSTWLRVEDVQTVSFTSQGRASGVCFGDSGGPAFIQQPNGEFAVAGINSAGDGGSGDGVDPCYGGSIQTRVDAYLSWIYWIMYGYGGCWDDPSVCACDGICREDGTCNPRDCYNQGENETCADLMDCFERPDCLDGDLDCYIDCYLSSSDSAREKFDEYVFCADNFCADARDYESCIRNSCEFELVNCFDEGPVIIERETQCESAVDCASYCDLFDWECLNFCETQNNGGAIFNEMVQCAQDFCGEERSEFSINGDCFLWSCAWMLSECFEYNYCDVEWEDCGAGKVCGAVPWGDTVCQESLLKREGERCIPHSFGNAIECGPGTICTDQGICEKVCEYEECNWNNEEYCDYGAVNYEDFSYFGSWRDLGACRCWDEDNDGVCSINDCDDYDANRSSEHHERCGDRIDNNCNGQIDEGCGDESCVDIDGDGYCGVNDCDESDPDVSIAGLEYCDDGIDNDCNGRIDDGCFCYDDDFDGFCAGVDCNDFDPGINPDQPEYCDDLTDNNCDGQIDEGCECLDEDGDGSCASQDCDDNDPARAPRAREICGNQIDEDCDGVDPECSSSSAEGRGARASSRGCQVSLGATGIARGHALVLWLLFLLIGGSLRARRRR